MGLFNKRLDGQTLQQLEDLAKTTVLRYTLKARGELSTPISLTDLTHGQVLNYLFGHKVDAAGASASDSVKEQFERRVLPFLPRIANEAIYRDEDLARLSFNALDIKAAYYEQHYGDAWKDTEVGARVADALNKVYNHEHGKTISLFSYRTQVFTIHAKYEKVASTVDWNEVFSIESYA